MSGTKSWPVSARRTDRTRVAVIGVGGWGINHVRVLVREPRCEVVALVDPDPAAIARACELVPSARSVEPDAVSATPASMP